MSQHGHVEKTYGIPPIHEGQGGPGSAGQSGDTQGLPDLAEAGSESVKELVEEGQYSEAEILLGVETAEDPDVSEVETRESRAKGASREPRDK